MPMVIIEVGVSSVEVVAVVEIQPISQIRVVFFTPESMTATRTESLPVVTVHACGSRIKE